MKIKHALIFAAALLWFTVLGLPPSTAFAQGTAFTYQGQLQNNGSPASGTYDLTFSLFNTNTTGVPIAVPVTNNAVIVTNGLFTVLIDFGPGAFTGATNWLEIGVETNGASPFTTLAPRQQLTPTPYAIYAENVSAVGISGTIPPASLGGTYGGAVTLNNAGNSFSGSFSGNGAGVTNVNAVALNGLNATNFWQTGGNNVAAGQFLGSTNNQSLEIRVGGVRAGLISPSNGLPDIVFGPAQNVISNTTAASSILGGNNNTIGTNSSYSVLGGGLQNNIQSSAGYSVLVGGYSDSIQTGSSYSALVGGYGNSIQSSAGYSTLGGGFNNSIQTSATYSFLGGGNANMIQGANLSVLVGGAGNTIQSGANDSFLGGGYGNNIDTNATYSVLGGGQQNNIQLGGAQNFIGGGYNNTILSSQSESVLVGGNANTLGGTWAFLGGGSHNTVAGITSAYAVLGGGGQNSIQGSANYAVLGGGADNIIQGNSYYSVIDGGYNNVIQGSGYGAVLVGGYQNSISNNAEYSFLGGGQGNFVGGDWATLGGGYGNMATNIFATVPGGSNNVAGGPFSFAAGANAQATNSGAFVWADAEGTPFSSTTSNQFNVRANGGVRFVTGGAGLSVDGQPVLAGSISLSQLLAEVVTNNEPNVSLGTLTLGSLMLPDPTTFNVRVPSFLPPYSINDTLLISVSGNNNLYLGLDAGSTNAASGVDNTGIGSLVLWQNTSGSYNTGEGYDVLASSTSGSYNTAIGGSALDALGYINGAGGSNNIALGYQAGINFTGNESGNIDIGNAGVQGENNVIRIGTPGIQTQTYVAGHLFSSGMTITNLTLPLPASIYAGSVLQSLLWADNNLNTYFGLAAGNGTNGYQNTAMGELALSANLTGLGNTANGCNALLNNTSGGGNVAIGDQALGNSTDDNNLVAIGYQALQNDNALYVESPGPGTISGNGENTAIGYQALQVDTGGYANTAVGSRTLTLNQNGYFSTAIGDNALKNNTSGYQNTAVGYNTLTESQTGNNNIALGCQAGQNLTGNESGNIDIGNSGVQGESDTIRIGTPGTQTATYLVGTVSVPVLTITGGSDLAEPFAISSATDQPVSEGEVLVIDDTNPGQLKLSDQPYDPHVAGVVSGANGIHPGIQMHQQGLLEGGRNVALTGRVYVQADTSNGVINPGDLLTTSSVPGHAMKVTDHARAAGAILGKAMSRLSEDKGMVLVLVTLQ